MKTYDIAGTTFTHAQLLELVGAVADGTGRVSVQTWNLAIDVETELLG